MAITGGGGDGGVVEEYETACGSLRLVDELETGEKDGYRDPQYVVYFVPLDTEDREERLSGSDNIRQALRQFDDIMDEWEENRYC